MKHTKKVEKYSGTLKELARDILNMRYDSLAELYKYLSEGLSADAEHDKILGHKQVSRLLKKLSENNLKSEEYARTLWKICKPYM
jgi:hypothetical protein